MKPSITHLPNRPETAPQPLDTLRPLLDTLEAAARTEGRALAGSTADDVPQLSEAIDATDAARHAVHNALLTTLAAPETAGGAR